MVCIGVMVDVIEVCWDIWFVLCWGIIEVRVCDGLFILFEFVFVVVLVQVFVEYFFCEFDEGCMLLMLFVWFYCENKWWVVCYGFGVCVIVDWDGMQCLVCEYFIEMFEKLVLVVVELGCGWEFGGIGMILDGGVSYVWQLVVVDVFDGNLVLVVYYFICEFCMGLEFLIEEF